MLFLGLIISGPKTHVMELERIQQLFGELYGSRKEEQLARYARLENKFREVFGDAELHWFSTPGRTEIGGNHTDHNLGRVLAGSIDLDSVAIAAPNQTSHISVYSIGFDGSFEVKLDQLEAKESELGTTTALIRGIAARLMELGYQVEGFNAYLASDVLPGSGLSSSASIEVLIGKIISSLFNGDQIPPEVLAITGQYAENQFFGKPCGLMDQVACAMGGIVTIDFGNPSEPQIRQVDFDFSAQEYSLVVVDTGGTHADLTDDYAAVPADMKKVAAALGKSVLREVSKMEILEHLSSLRESCGDRAVLRALHFEGDNQRVVEQVAALEEGRFQDFLGMVSASGNSSHKRLQNIYSPTMVDEQGVALGLALTEVFIEDLGEGACRVHGGGFAGTIQAFLPNRAIEALSNLLAPVFGEGSVHVLKIRPQGALHLNSLV